jgi:putative oxidoreductase
MRLASAVLRGVIGGLFVGHGTQKLFGWFDGHGLEGTAGFFETLGLRPGKRHATAAGLAEAGGGALLALGALTPLSTSVLSATMVTAIRKVHAKNGPWVTGGGYEYNLVLIAALTALAETGPGAASVDGALFPRLHGGHWAAFSLATALAGSYLATADQLMPADEPSDVAERGGDPASAPTGRFTKGQAQAAEGEVTSSS